MFSLRSHGCVFGIGRMPEAHPSANPAKNRKMHHAAADGMIITMRCSLCRRDVHYWAADLVKVLGPNHQVHVPPWPCSKCRRIDFVQMRWQVATKQLLDGLTVRRPVRQITKWLWRDERA
jgi:hypothetical protein